MKVQFTHLRLLVSNYSETFRFYRDILGLEVDWGNENTGYAEFNTGFFKLTVLKKEFMLGVVSNTLQTKISQSEEKTEVSESEEKTEISQSEEKAEISQSEEKAEFSQSEEKAEISESEEKAALIFAVDDVDEVYENLKANNVNFINSPVDRPEWGLRTAHLRDPDGNLIEIYTNLGILN
ncbi:MAG TPA: VOC family protein [Nostocaceae cyanobacterium]|nr:VOC family protein [Nostocaceae cyanobacterium]